MTAKHRTISLAGRGFDFETTMWYFTRLSALAMYLCAFIGLIGALIMGARTQMNLADLIRWMFMPNPNHVLLNTSNNILDPDAWMTLFWKITGIVFIFFATSHGLHGLLSVVEDYITRPWVRRTLRILGVVLTLLMIGIGVYVLWTS
jgi:succinate dehydrogenase hydrophobic anchor subunit